MFNYLTPFNFRAPLIFAPLKFSHPFNFRTPSLMREFGPLGALGAWKLKGAKIKGSKVCQIVLYIELDKSN